MEDSAAASQSHLRMRGGRYEGVGFPVEALSELIQYDRLVTDLAKHLWLTRHDKRVRAPKGFTTGVRLRLTEIRNGSTIPIMTPESDTSDQLDIQVEDLVTESQELIDQAFAEIVKNNALPSTFPHNLAHHFVRIGKTLRDDESIEFGKIETETPVVRYTRAVRMRFLAATQDKDFQIEGTATGRITALDTESLTFKLITPTGEEIEGAYSEPSLTEDLHQVFNQQSIAPLVRVTGTLLITPQERTKRIDDVDDLEAFFPDTSLPNRAEIESLLTLRDGWLDGAGLAPSIVAVEQAREVSSTFYAQHLPLPSVFPLESGGVQAQWFTATDVWTSVISTDGLIESDWLDVKSNTFGESQQLTAPEVAEFFKPRWTESE